MARNRTRYVCQECAAVSVKWQGRCTECGKWNTMVEEPDTVSPVRAGHPASRPAATALTLDQVAAEHHERFFSGVGEFDRVAGGGIVPGSLILVGGPPGIGKSTLLLQIAEGVGKSGREVLYVCGEESLAQVRMRAGRLGVTTQRLKLLSEIELETVRATVAQVKPKLVLVDSIQTMFTSEVESAPGSVSQVRECTAALMRLAKSTGVTYVIVGHVTKEGSLAGPRVMEHLVDTVLYFEGDRLQNYRILKAVKNRFGSTSEVGLFEMQGRGLIDVPNASEFFLSQRIDDNPGSTIVPIIEGSRAMLVEVQALCNESHFGTPARRATGLDANRLMMLLAVLQKRAGVRGAGQSDVFINVAGGMEVDEPAADLGVLVAIASSVREQPLRSGLAVIGEVGLGGEVRAVTQAQQRVAECERMGIREVVLPASNLQARGFERSPGVTLRGVRNVREALRACLDADRKPPRRSRKGDASSGEPPDTDDALFETGKVEFAPG